MKKSWISVAAAVACASASAEGIDFKLSGFGTIGGVITNADAGYRATSREASGADKNVDFGVDSRLGVQGDVRFNDTFSAVGQLLASRRVGSDGLPAVEWLYGQADLPAGFKLKLGRMVLPIFMLSDTRAVGYTQFWQRTPTEVYVQFPNSSLNGGQLQYNGALGPVNMTVQLSAGNSNTPIYALGLSSLSVDYRNLKSLAVTAEYGNWLARVGETRGDLSLAEVGFTSKDKFDSVGLQYDNGSLVAIVEYIKRTGSNPALNTPAYYAGAGWRFGAWTPYVLTSHSTTNHAASDSTQALGLRWDAIKNVDVKLQAAKVIGGLNTFASPTAGFLASRPSVRVFSFGIDFVF